MVVVQRFVNSKDMVSKMNIVSKQLVPIITFCFSLIFVSCSKDWPMSYSSDEDRWLHELTASEFHGRKTGTKECRSAADYIVRELEQMGYNPRIEEFSYRDSITMRNIIVEISGNNDSISIIGAHYDGAVYSSKYQAANDNASGVVALLSIAKSIRAHNNSILLCFWDGEENTEGSAYNGSRYFIEQSDIIDSVKWYCNIDCCGRVNEPIYLYSSIEMKEIFQGATILSNYSLDIIKKVQDSESSDYVPFKERGIPFWGWNDSNVLSYIHTRGDSTSKISITKIQLVSEITINLLLNLL